VGNGFDEDSAVNGGKFFKLTYESGGRSDEGLSLGELLAKQIFRRIAMNGREVLKSRENWGLFSRKSARGAIRGILGLVVF